MIAAVKIGSLCCVFWYTRTWPKFQPYKLPRGCIRKISVSCKNFIHLLYLKKASVIFLCIFYFFVACGFNVSLHYCAGKLKGISFVQNKEDSCCGSKKRSKGCCKEKTVVYKIKDNHESASKIVAPNMSAKNLFAVFAITEFKLHRPVIDLYAVPESNAPPFDNPEPTYLLNRNFRI